MIVHLFNSSSISGPERLVLPALASAPEHFVVINLREERIQQLREADPLEQYARSLKLDYCDVRVCGHWDYVAIRDLRALLDRLNPDLVHAHDVKASAYLQYARHSGSARYPIVSTHHGVHGRPDWKTRLYEQLYRRYFLKTFDRVFAVSRADYETLLGSGIDGRRLRLHWNGIDGTALSPLERADQRQEIRERWLPDEPGRDALFLMGVIGRLSAEKDHSRLLRVLKSLDLRASGADWRCLLFGTGPLENQLREESRKLGLEKRLVWMGYQNNVGRQLAGLDMVLSFSKAEGLPISLIEAGWTATPVFCTRVGGIPDLIPDESYGTAIPPKESPRDSAVRLQACLSAEGRVKLMHQAQQLQQNVVTEFTQKRWMQRLSDLYAELGVGFGTSTLKAFSWPTAAPEESGTFQKRLQTTLFTRLLMYQSGRLQDIRAWNQNGFRILMYHHFQEGTAQREALARQCAHLTRHYRVVSMRDVARHLQQGIPLPPNAVALTVDDGYRDFLYHAQPVFRAYGLPVTVFLTSGFVDRECWLWWDWIRYIVEHTPRTSFAVPLSSTHPPTLLFLSTPEQRRQAVSALTATMKLRPHAEKLEFLAELPKLLNVRPPSTPPPSMEPLEWSEIRRLADQGVEFGAHTRTHPILSRVNDPEILRDEIKFSKQRIEEQLDRPVLHFAYPNGLREDINALSVKVVEECHFQTAVTAERGINYQGAHPFWLRRIGVEPSTSKFNLEVLVAGLGGSRSMPAPFAAPVPLLPTVADVVPQTPESVHAH